MYKHESWEKKFVGISRKSVKEFQMAEVKKQNKTTKRNTCRNLEIQRRNGFMISGIRRAIGRKVLCKNSKGCVRLKCSCCPW